jgi:hypothetical protein
MSTLDDERVLAWQKAQYKHDKRNHFDILSRHKVDRLKHYALHFAKYAGRLARGENAAQKTEVQTAVDSILVSLSAANTVSHRLSGSVKLLAIDASWQQRLYTDAAGRYCDAVEKLDHAEFDGARTAMVENNQALFEIAMNICIVKSLDVEGLLRERRQYLVERSFFIED